MLEVVTRKTVQKRGIPRSLTPHCTTTTASVDSRVIFDSPAAFGYRK
jgi:hypothetical protein